MRLLYSLLFLTFLFLGEAATLSEFWADKCVELMEQSSEDKKEKEGSENIKVELDKINQNLSFHLNCNLDFNSLAKNPNSRKNLYCQFVFDIHLPPPEYKA